jgi:protein-S-isoprenylcysteine O-methyltransferase Ste14
MFLLFGAIGVGVFVAIAPRMSAAAPRLPIPGSPPVLLACGLVALIAGIGLRWYSIRSLGRFFTMNVAVQAGHRVVRTGPYRWVRHPSYTGLLLACAGVGVGRLVNSIRFLGRQAFIQRLRTQTALSGSFGSQQMPPASGQLPSTAGTPKRRRPSEA